jgi:hypothetical protein
MIFKYLIFLFKKNKNILINHIMEKYLLINPYIIGGKNTVEASTPIDAAKQLWNTLSDKISNYVPKFYFSIKNMKGGDIHHFSAIEEVDDDVVNFKISSINGKVNEEKLLEKIKEHIKDYKKQLGGKHHHHKEKEQKKDDDSSSSSSSSSTSTEEKLVKALKKHRRSVPLSFIDYYPSIYTDYNSVYIPSFGYTKPYNVSGDVIVSPPPRIYFGSDVILTEPYITTTDLVVADTLKKWSVLENILRY